MKSMLLSNYFDIFCQKISFWTSNEIIHIMYVGLQICTNHPKFCGTFFKQTDRQTAGDQKSSPELSARVMKAQVMQKVVVEPCA